MNFITPKSKQQAIEHKAQNPDYHIMAGGTDLTVLIHSKIINPKGMINLWGVNELAGITENNDQIEMGVLATHTQIVESGIIQKHMPVLAKACKQIGATQIQNRGTIGGNVMNASPAGDTLPVLLAYEAIVVASSVNGDREIPFTEFYTGYRQTALNKNEIITKIKIKKPVKNEKADFLKVGTRKAQAISKIMGCFRAELTENNTITKFYGALGSVAATPVRLPQTEAYLTGKTLTDDVITEAIKITQNEVNPISDIRSTAEYRKHVAGVLLKKFIQLSFP